MLKSPHVTIQPGRFNLLAEPGDPVEAAVNLTYHVKDRRKLTTIHIYRDRADVPDGTWEELLDDAFERASHSVRIGYSGDKLAAARIWFEENRSEIRRADAGRLRLLAGRLRERADGIDRDAAELEDEEEL